MIEDADWREAQVIASGHEVLGEGEYKIMEYIRLCRAQPDYNLNVQHYLYELDARISMLDLPGHDPPLCLLHEEVKFSPVAKKDNGRFVINFTSEIVQAHVGDALGQAGSKIPLLPLNLLPGWGVWDGAVVRVWI